MYIILNVVRIIASHVSCFYGKTLGFTITQRTRSAKKENNSPLRPLNKPVEEKKPLIPFEKMAQYISLLDDADEMMDEFDVVRSIAKSEEHPRK